MELLNLKFRTFHANFINSCQVFKTTKIKLKSDKGMPTFFVVTLSKQANIMGKICHERTLEFTGDHEIAYYF